MPIIQWTEDFSIGHPDLDAQHKTWVSIYNQAHDRMMDPDETEFQSTGIDALKEMKAYSRHHFKMEEAYMAEIGYPQLEAHKAMHQHFARQIETMISDLSNGTHVLNSEVIKRIETWLTHHILKEDKKIQDFADRQG